MKSGYSNRWQEEELTVKYQKIVDCQMGLS